MRDHRIQRLGASFLLAVFIFINAVKTFHTHAYAYSAQQENSNKNATAFKAYFFCTICDFQFSKDSDTEVAAINIAVPVHVVATFYNYLLPTIADIAVTSSVRGPPVLVC